MEKVLVTGGAGFFGGILLSELRLRGVVAESLDILPLAEGGGAHHQIDLTNKGAVESVVGKGGYGAIFHCAAQLAHERASDDSLWRANVGGAENLVRACEKHGVGCFVCVSSNCVFGRSYPRPVGEDEPPTPAEIYGKSKLAAEEIVLNSALPAASVFRVPTILDEGRVGLLALLFEFVRENRKVWLIGGGGNRYQFIYAKDLAAAMTAAAESGARGLFNAGADDVPTMAECFQFLINHAGSRSRLVKIPRAPSVLALRFLHALNLSPLGPYHWRMIASDFVFDTSKAKAAFGWKPGVGNAEALARAYDHWANNPARGAEGANSSPHKRAAKMGALRLLKWLS